jgi:hypothetical protein
VVNGINGSEMSFSGVGAADGINFNETGKALIIPRSTGSLYMQGSGVIRSDNSSEKASYTFQEIGKIGADRTIKANGAAFFGSNAIGKLAFLNDMVVIYQELIDMSGNSNLTAWKWK